MWRFVNSTDKRAWLKEKINDIPNYDHKYGSLRRWTEKLSWILDNFIQTFKGKPDVDFWNQVILNKSKVARYQASALNTTKATTGY